MLSVSDTASEEFGKVLDSQQATGKHLILFFQGFG